MRTTIGPQGQKRPADVASNAVHVGRLLVGDIEETYVEGAATLKEEND